MKCAECGRSLAPPQQTGVREVPLKEVADTKTQKMGLAGFNATGFDSEEGCWGQSKSGHGKRRNSRAIAQLLCNGCTLKTLKTREVVGNQLFMGTIALPFVNSCVAFCELMGLFPRPLLLQYPSYT